ncbi:uncharacterized protein MYCFIDRAFT_84439 [Pseudocercospora fijiensis CIRAD86]|uniref:Uncharacterized protein n=1 Tax=Pseudocercospora fijiensis (strain CIRAD86) TaxID=383855 RepID=M2YG24_PSEFD|nr:uncharacterized protein MYCFIDRAFT_84439 [Pseudocercospora fijiensis CIRAD86]EME76750.1 hypothetical protein MYCFIDRAFT_84439 [Pseudocercospora fijiensis CIRAD86]
MQLLQGATSFDEWDRKWSKLSSFMAGPSAYDAETCRNCQFPRQVLQHRDWEWFLNMGKHAHSLCYGGPCRETEFSLRDLRTLDINASKDPPARSLKKATYMAGSFGTIGWKTYAKLPTNFEPDSDDTFRNPHTGTKFMEETRQDGTNTEAGFD